MAYVKDIEITDLESAVKHIHKEFSNLSFDAHHEAIYGMGRFYTYEECEELGDTYDKAVSFCDQYLDDEIPLSRLVHELLDLKMYSFLTKLKPYLPRVLLEACNLKWEEEEEEEDSTDSDSQDEDKLEEVEKDVGKK